MVLGGCCPRTAAPYPLPFPSTPVQVMMIFWFTGLAIAAVGKTAGEVVREVRRQLKENPGIMDYKQKPDYRACVSLVTQVKWSTNLRWSTNSPI